MIGNIDKHDSVKLHQLQYRSTREEIMKLTEENLVSNTKMVKSEFRGVTSIEAEEAVASSLFKGPCIITIANEAAASYFYASASSL